MEKRIINPWKWQDNLNYVQAVEVRNVQSTLYCAGQAAVNADGISSTADMKDQIVEALQNLEKVITDAGYECRDIVRLNIFTTSEAEFLEHFDIFQEWTVKHGTKQATSLFQVEVLYETLKVEFEATAVK